MNALNYALLGLGTGAIYALSAQGIVLAYRSSGVINFANGAIGMFAAFIFYDLRDSAGWDTAWAMPATLLIGAGIGAAVFLLVMRPLQNAPRTSKIIASLGLYTFFQALALKLWGGELRLVIAVLPNNPVSLGDDLSLGEDRFWLLGIALAATVALTLMYRYLRFGLATTAAHEDALGASALGWSPNLIGTVNWALAGLLAAGAATLIAQIAGLEVALLSSLVVPALAAALGGGFRSFALTTAVALAIGVSQALLVPYVHVQGITSTAPLLFIVALLVFRGKGLPQRGELVLQRMPAVGDGLLKPRVAVPMLALTLVGIVLFQPIWNDALSASMVGGVLLLSVVVVAGYAGQLSLAQLSLAGFGGMIAYRLFESLGAQMPVALVIGALAAIPMGLLVALPALRTRGMTLAVATLALAVAINTLVLANPKFNGAGITGEVPTPKVFGWSVDGRTFPERYGILCLSVLTLVSIVVLNLRRSRSGRRLLTIRSNERAAASLGISVQAGKLYAFTVAAAIAGLAGVLMTLRTTNTNFFAYELFGNIYAVVLTVLGGVGFVAGALTGALLYPAGILFRAVDSLGVSDSAAEYLVIFSGVSTIMVLIRHPDGLAPGTVEGLKHRFGGLARRTRHAKESMERRLRTIDIAVPPHHIVTASHDVALDVHDVSVRYGGVVAVDRVSLSLRSGTVSGLIGPNGAGKSSLIDALTGFIPVAGGRVEADGRAVTRWSPSRLARAGVVRTFQSVDLFDDLTVFDNVCIAAEEWSPGSYLTDLVRPRRVDMPIPARVAVRELELTEDLDRLPTELAYGERRLVGIARALALAPNVLLLDEPAAGLNSHETDHLAAIIQRVAHEWGIAVLLVEHDVEMVMKVADHIHVIDFGRIIADGTPAEVRANPTVIGAYLGDAFTVGGEVVPAGDRS